METTKPSILFFKILGDQGALSRREWVSLGQAGWGQVEGWPTVPSRPGLRSKRGHTGDWTIGAMTSHRYGWHPGPCLGSPGVCALTVWPLPTSPFLPPSPATTPAEPWPPRTEPGARLPPAPPPQPQRRWRKQTASRRGPRVCPAACRLLAWPPTHARLSRVLSLTFSSLLGRFRLHTNVRTSQTDTRPAVVIWCPRSTASS